VPPSPAERAPLVDLVFAVMVAELIAERSAVRHARPGSASAGGPSRSAPRDWDAGGLAAVLDAHAPGAALVALLAGLEPADVSDAALVEAIAAWDRVMSLAAARQGDLIAELTRRRTATRTEEFVGDEVAARLGTTRAVAEAKVELAVCLDLMPEVRVALASGDIDVRKATALTNDLAHLPVETARAVQVQVLPDAPDLTVPQIRARLRTIELTLDPAAGEARHVRARADRHVRLTPAPDAMAWLTALLPADDATAAFAAIDAIAASADPDDPRPIDARRADALTDICAQILNTGVGPAGPLVSSHRRRPHLQVTVAATTLLGLDEKPGELAGFGPIPATMVRAIAADATWRRIFTDPETGEFAGIGSRTYRPGADLTRTVIARDVTCTFPGCRIAAWRCDLDHIEPFGESTPGEDQTTRENLHALCRHHHRLKTHTGWTITRDTPTGATDWTAPTGHRYRRPSVPAEPADPAPPHPRVPAPDLGPPPF